MGWREMGWVVWEDFGRRIERMDNCHGSEHTISLAYWWPTEHPLGGMEPGNTMKKGPQSHHLFWAGEECRRWGSTLRNWREALIVKMAVYGPVYGPDSAPKVL